MKKENCKGFRCPEVVPPFAPDDFCIPKDCCPDRFETFKFPSPNSCLPEEILQELELRIRNANKFLLDLALSSEREKNEIFQNAFDGLIGQEVIVELNCAAETEEGEDILGDLAIDDEEENEENVIVKGRVFLAGRDFSILRNGKKEILVPHEKICFLDLTNRFAEPFDTPSLNEIDPCFRRCLTFRFGEVVSGSLELIQIFFRLTLKIFLLKLIDQKVKVRLEDETVIGTIFNVGEEFFELRMDDQKKVIGLEDVCLMIIEEC